MNCVVCRHPETESGEATVTLERDKLTFVVKGVPAQVCPNCGEQYVDEVIAADLLKTAEELARKGAQVEIRQYVRAS